MTGGARPFAVTTCRLMWLSEQLHMSPSEVMTIAVEVIARDLENGSTNSRVLHRILRALTERAAKPQEEDKDE